MQPLNFVVFNLNFPFFPLPKKMTHFSWKTRWLFHFLFFSLFFRRRCAYRTSGKWKKKRLKKLGNWLSISPPLAGVSSSFPFRGKRQVPFSSIRYVSPWLPFGVRNFRRVGVFRSVLSTANGPKYPPLPPPPPGPRTRSKSPQYGASHSYSFILDVSGLSSVTQTHTGPNIFRIHHTHQAGRACLPRCRLAGVGRFGTANDDRSSPNESIKSTWTRLKSLTDSLCNLVSRHSRNFSFTAPSHVCGCGRKLNTAAECPIGEIAAESDSLKSASALENVKWILRLQVDGKWKRGPGLWTAILAVCVATRCVIVMATTSLDGPISGTIVPFSARPWAQEKRSVHWSEVRGAACEQWPFLRWIPRRLSAIFTQQLDHGP